MQCQFISNLVDKIKAGASPDDAIPYSIPNNLDRETLIELYAFSVKHLSDKNRVAICKQKLEELSNVSR